MPMDGVERRLSAILSADVVGYSRLMAEDEDATVRRLAAYRDEIALLVDQHGGRVVDFNGDNFLAEFPSAVNTTRCAVEIQGVLRARNASLAQDQKMEFRMGIHLGDVRVEGDRIFGDGVNIAARLEGLAEPGGLCISGTVHDQVRAKLELDFVDLGENEVKNIPTPVRVYCVRIALEAAPAVAVRRPWQRVTLAAVALAAVLAAIAAVWRFRPAGDSEVVTPATVALEFNYTVAVLPFENIAGDNELNQVARGLPEELINRLGLIWSVRDRASSFSHEGEEPCAAAAALDSRFVLDGSLRTASDLLRISVQLLRCPERQHLWTRSYNRSQSTDLLVLQDEVATAIVAEIQQVLWQNFADGSIRGSVYWYLNRSSKEDSQLALAKVRAAVAATPDLVTWTAYANVYQQILREGWWESPDEAIAEMERAARGMCEIQRGFSCHLFSGWAAYWAGSPEKLVPQLELVVEKSDGIPVAHSFLGLALAMVGKPGEGLARIEKAIEDSPNDPAMSQFLQYKAVAHFGIGDYEEAQDAARRSTQLPPDVNNPHADSFLYLAASLAHLGRLDEARAALEEARELRPAVRQEWVSVYYRGADPDWRERFSEGLRMAGLGE